MNVNKSLRTVSAALVIAGMSASSLLAASATANLSVSATVANNCTISSNAISFGSYDPIVAQATANLDAAGSVVITCTKGATTTIGLDTGANASAGARRLASSGSFLTYDLFQDSGRSTVWSNTGAGLLSVVAAPSKAARTYPVYARMAGGQDVPAGTYTDTIVATVNF
jgi:spore coat protein U-like protein